MSWTRTTCWRHQPGPLGLSLLGHLQTIDAMRFTLVVPAGPARLHKRDALHLGQDSEHPDAGSTGDTIPPSDEDSSSTLWRGQLITTRSRKPILNHGTFCAESHNADVQHTAKPGLLSTEHLSGASLWRCDCCGSPKARPFADCLRIVYEARNIS